MRSLKPQFHASGLDIFHALEHVNETGKIQFGEGTKETQRWQGQARDAFLAEGWKGIERLIDQTRPIAVRAPQRLALDALANYLGGHRDRLTYGKRSTIRILTMGVT